MRPTRLLATCAAAAAVVATVAIPASAATSDPLFDQQWGLQQIHAEQAWPTSTGSGTTIAIVDTGVDLTHPDLNKNLVQGATFTGCKKQARPCGNGDWKGPDGKGDELDTHGSHVAGIAAAVTDNGIGIAGTAPDADIMPVKVLEEGAGDFGEIAEGIKWAADNGADVVNLSLGALPGTQLLTYTGVISDVSDAIAYANEKGVAVVAAAGNEYVAPLCDTPAFDDGAICVVATDPNELKASYSNFGLKPDMKVVAAPGGAGLGACEDDIVSTVPQGTGAESCGESDYGKDYDDFAGTSMATPHVAGVAGLLFAQGRDLAGVEEVLLTTSRTPGAGTGVFSPLYGWGIVDAEAAVAAPVEGEAPAGAGGLAGWIGSLFG